MKWQVLGWGTGEEGKKEQGRERGEGKRMRKKQGREREELDKREREQERDKTAKYLVLESPAVRGGCGLVDPLEGVLTCNY